MSRKHKIPGIFATSLTRYQTMSGQSLSKFAASLYYILRCVVASCPDSLCAYLMTEILYPYVSLKRRPTNSPSKSLGTAYILPSQRHDRLRLLIGCSVCASTFLPLGTRLPLDPVEICHQGISRTVALKETIHQ